MFENLILKKDKILRDKSLIKLMKQQHSSKTRRKWSEANGALQKVDFVR